MHMRMYMYTCTMYMYTCNFVLYTTSLGSRPAFPILFRALIVRGRDTLKTGKAWDDTSCEDRRKVMQRNIASTTNIIDSRAFDVHTGA